MGTLRIVGVINITQFWTLGSSDADATKLRLEAPSQLMYARGNLIIKF